MPGAYNKRSHDWVWSWIWRACRRSSSLAKALEISGSVASFTSWQRARGFDGTPGYPTRGRLWHATSPRLRRGKVTVLELGVAAGDATSFWLSMLTNPDLRWHGFDTFSGLPEPWIRGGVEFARSRTFNRGDRPPDINDERVTWHVGRVGHTLRQPQSTSAHRCSYCSIWTCTRHPHSHFDGSPAA